MATKRCRSRHQRHLRLLDKLYRLGWVVESCYARFPSGVGCYAELDYDKRRHVFYPFNERTDYMSQRTFAPPLKNAGNHLHFVVVPGLYLWGKCSPHVIWGWKPLSRFVRLAERGEAK